MAWELEPVISTTSAGRATLIYSLWPGYLDRPGSDLRSWCASQGVALTLCHTSGHADPPTLMRLARGFDARHVVPIHTVVPQRFRDMFPNAVVLDDGEWFAP
jgi:ribonuclease J